MTPEDNERLTRVEGDAAMGRMIREYHWVPAMRAGRLAREGGAPTRVRLVGRNYVIFRAEDGRLACFDEACPHRGTSLSLARQEGNAIRCIFHGWKFDVSGAVLEVPTESRDPEAFAARVKVKHHPIREAGGILWVWLGAGAPAAFPDFGFTHVAEDQRFVAYTEIPVNWMQAIDATVDSAHIGYLHRDTVLKGGGHRQTSMQNFAPQYEFSSQPYGYRAAALRPLADGSSYVRIGEFVMPFYSSTLPNQLDTSTMQILVPLDDVTTGWYLVRWNRLGQTLDTKTDLAPEGADLDNWVPIQGSWRDRWGQDRQAMRDGSSFSGFSRGLLAEDTVVQVAMGAIVDRSNEHLSSSDAQVVRTRRLFLQAAKDVSENRVPVGAASPEFPYRELYAAGGILPAGEKWEERFPAPMQARDLRAET
jgi:phthalate 4,5-dioxygenase oxygenase subunit